MQHHLFFFFFKLTMFVSFRWSTQKCWGLPSTLIQTPPLHHSSARQAAPLSAAGPKGAGPSKKPGGLRDLLLKTCLYLRSGQRRSMTSLPFLMAQKPTEHTGDEWKPPWWTGTCSFSTLCHSAHSKQQKRLLKMLCCFSKLKIWWPEMKLDSKTV